MTGRPRAVVDTNVLVAAVIKPSGVCAQLIVAAVDRRWQPAVSSILLAELTEVLRRPKFRRWLTIREADAFVCGIRDVAEIVADPPSGAAGASRDPDDDYLVALARVHAVDALVSGDGDLTVLAQQQPPVRTPGEFLSLLGGVSTPGPN